MLKIICEAFQGLKKKAISRGFEGIASGQKSMTYILETFIKRIGRDIGAKLGLSQDFFWYLLKGSKHTRSKLMTGIAIEIGRAWCRARVCHTVSHSLVDESFKKQSRVNSS